MLYGNVVFIFLLSVSFIYYKANYVSVNKTTAVNNLNELKTLETHIEGGIARIALNRPEVRNAFNGELINDLFEAFEYFKENDETRVIILTGAGKTFCAGADLNWMKSVVDYSYEQNYQESVQLANLIYFIYSYPKPVIARLNGAAIGGGVGLMSACDIIIAADNAKFGLSEVRLGLVPSAISPYVIRRIGEAKAKEFFITGERITAIEAEKIDLVNKIVPLNKLDETVNEKAENILKNGPKAVRAAKELILKISESEIREVQDYTAKLIAELRTSEEGQEGMNAFLEKRKPKWLEE